MKLIVTSDLFQHQLDHHKNETAIVCRSTKEWLTYSTKDCISQINKFSSYLKAQSVEQGSKVILIPGSATAQFVFIDLAIQQMQCITVMVHQTMSNVQIDEIISEVKPALIVFSQNAGRKDQLEYLSKYKMAIAIEAIELSAVLEDNTILHSAPKETSTIIYTSGTSGRSKGVMLSHENIMSNVSSLVPLLPINNKSKVLSYLPYSHIFERTSIYSYIASGASIYLINEVNYLPKALSTIKPNLFTAVPRIIERMYQEVFVYSAKKSPLVKAFIKWSLKAGIQYYDKGGFKPLGWLKLVLLRQTVFKKFRKKLGGNLKAIIVGAAHLNPEIAKIFAAAKIPLREGYGMTEASPVITVNRMPKGLHKLGTVGLPLPSVKIKINDPDESGQGEIWVKGKNVMQGYFNRPEETASVLDDNGWLKTGDIGKLIDHKFLKITDRKKDIFKTSAGKYISPQVLLEHFIKTPFIERILIIGFQKPFVGALIYPNYILLEEWANAEKIHWTSPKYMALNIKVKGKIQEEIDNLNKDLPAYQRIKIFLLLTEDWSVEKGQLSNTLKPIRQKILADYSKEIEKSYANQ